jgi:hypothetical protein
MRERPLTRRARRAFRTDLLVSRRTVTAPSEISLPGVPAELFLAAHQVGDGACSRPKTANAMMTRPMPVRISATPTTMLKIEICSAM